MVDSSPEKNTARVLAVILAIFGALLGVVYHSTNLDADFIKLSLQCTHLSLSLIAFILFVSSRRDFGDYWFWTLLVIVSSFGMVVLMTTGIDNDSGIIVLDVVNQFVSACFKIFPLAVIVTQILGGIYSLLKS